MISEEQKKNLLALIVELGNLVEKIKNEDHDYSFKSDNSPLTKADIIVNERLIAFTNQTNFKNVISEENSCIDYTTRKKMGILLVNRSN